MFVKSARLELDDKDTLVMEDGKKKGSLAINDAGTLVVKGDGAKDPPPGRVDGMTPKARRAALLLSMSIARAKKKT